MLNRPNITLGVIVRDITSDYLLDQYCIHYSKYDEIKHAIVIIQGEASRIKGYFLKYFGNRVRFEYYDGKYMVEKEESVFTDLLKTIQIDDWLLIADMDEFIHIENIHSAYFLHNDLISGVLIDRVKAKGHCFDNTLNIFENYSECYHFISIIRVSYPNKVPLIKNTGVPIIIFPGHHFISRNTDIIINHSFGEKIHIHHFKWRVEFNEYNKLILDEIDLEKDPKAQVWRNELVFYSTLFKDGIYTDYFYEFIKPAKMNKIF